LGTYATTTSLQAITFLTFDSATTAMATECITDAEAEVNKLLAKRYDVGAWSTSAATPPTIQSLAKRYAEGLFWQRNSRGNPADVKRGQDILDGVMANLCAIAEGKASIVDAAGDIVATRTGRGVLSSTDSYTPTFGEDSDLNWRPDSDKVTDTEDARD
jgi:hypothetical protein